MPSGNLVTSSRHDFYISLCFYAFSRANSKLKISANTHPEPNETGGAEKEGKKMLNQSYHVKHTKSMKHVKCFLVSACSEVFLCGSIEKVRAGASERAVMGNLANCFLISSPALVSPRLSVARRSQPFSTPGRSHKSLILGEAALVSFYSLFCRFLIISSSALQQFLSPALIHAFPRHLL